MTLDNTLHNIKTYEELEDIPEFVEYTINEMIDKNTDCLVRVAMTEVFKIGYALGRNEVREDKNDRI